MKKTLTIAILFVMLATLTLTGVKAATATLANDLYTRLAPYGATNADKVRVERYLADNTVTDAQSEEIVALVDEAIAVMKSEGTTDYSKLSESGKSRVKSLAQSAANVIGLTLTFENGTVHIYDTKGKLIEAQDSTVYSGKLSYTGNNGIVLVVSSIAVIALAATVVAKKRFAKVGA